MQNTRKFSPRTRADIPAAVEHDRIGQELHAERKRLADELRRIDGVPHLPSPQESRIAGLARNLLAKVKGKPERPEPIEQETDAATIHERIAACDSAIDQWEARGRILDNEIARELWKDYEAEDLRIRREEIFAPLVAAAEGRRKLTAHRAVAMRNGACQTQNIQYLPFINCSAAGKLPGVLQTLANNVATFRETNRNLLSTKG